MLAKIYFLLGRREDFRMLGNPFEIFIKHSGQVCNFSSGFDIKKKHTEEIRSRSRRLLLTNLWANFEEYEAPARRIHRF